MVGMSGGADRPSGRLIGRPFGRRGLLAGMGLAPVLAPAVARAQGLPPIVFVHGNGDSSALWINNLWRFEANGFRRNQLFAIDFAPPNARSDDSKAQPNRSSTEDQLRELSNYVAQVRKATRRPRAYARARSTSCSPILARPAAFPNARRSRT